MNTVNISNKEGYERYQMPELESRVKNLGKYNNSYIENLPRVAQALHLNYEVLVKYFGWTLNTQSKFDKKTEEVQLKGEFTNDILKETLRKFIDKYVLCPKCSLPELDFQCKKKTMRIKCRACGHSEICELTDRVYKSIHQEDVISTKDKKTKA